MQQVAASKQMKYTALCNRLLRLLTPFCRALWMPRGSMGVTWKKNQGRKNVRCGKLDKGTVSVESLSWKEQEEYLEMITVCWLLFMLFLWHLLLATEPGKAVVWLDFAAVVHLVTETQILRFGPPTASMCLKAEATWVRGLSHEAGAQMDTCEIPKYL